MNTTSLIPLDTTLPEICAFNSVYSFTMWTQMKPLLVHLDAILPEICVFSIGFSSTVWTIIRSLWAD